MEKFYRIWQPVLNSFKMHYPEMYEQMIDWHPSARLQIAVKLNTGRYITYDLVDDIIRINYDPYAVNDELNEDLWRDNFAKRLNNLMRTGGITQSRLSDITGISMVTLSKYMNGKAIPSGYNIYRISRALKCSVAELTSIS